MGDSAKYGDITVKNLNTERFSDYSVRTFSVIRAVNLLLEQLVSHQSVVSIVRSLYVVSALFRLQRYGYE